jgi:hypothetical protein
VKEPAARAFDVRGLATRWGSRSGEEPRFTVSRVASITELPSGSTARRESLYRRRHRHFARANRTISLLIRFVLVGVTKA